MRSRAASVLGNIGNEKAVEPLIVVALNHESIRERCYAVEALKKIGNKKAVEGLILAFLNNESYVREIAASALENIGSLTVLEALIRSPDINLYDYHIFPVAKRLAIKNSKSGSSFIPVYPELISHKLS